MFQKIAKHRANDASNDVHRPPLGPSKYLFIIPSPLLMRLLAPMSIDLWMLLCSQGHLVSSCTSCELGCYALLCMYGWAFGNVEEGFI